MELLIGIVLLLLAFAGLAIPLFVSRPRSWAGSGNGTGDLIADRDGVYATLRDLDQDYQLGKLNEADYHSRREGYMGRAARILEQIDSLRAPALNSLESDRLEKEIAALRNPAGSSPNGHTAQTSRGEHPVYCPNCGHPVRSDDQYCGKCGRALS